MSPEERDAFFTVHRDLPREGPGEAADVRWALDQLGLSGPIDVLDAACGPGADLVELADALPQARIDMLRGQSPDTALRAALDENQLEIDRWHAAQDDISYALLIAVPE